MTDVDWPRRAGLSAALDEAAIVAITDRAGRILYCNDTVSYTHLTLPTIYSV